MLEAEHDTLEHVRTGALKKPSALMASAGHLLPTHSCGRHHYSIAALLALSLHGVGVSTELWEAATN